MAAYPIQSLPNGQVRWSDGSQRGPQSTQQGIVSTQMIPNTKNVGGYQVPNQSAPAPTPQPANNNNNNSGIVNDGSDEYYRKMGFPNGRQGFLDSGLAQQGPAQPTDNSALFQPILDSLDQLSTILDQNTQNRIGEFQQGANTDTQSAQQSFAQQQKTLDASGQQAMQRGESAADEARRQYAEIAQGQQARYGGSTGTGRFANEILGSQTTKNISQIRQQVSDFMFEIDTKKQQIEEIGRIALQDIQDKTKASIQQAQDNLQVNLNSIRQQKGELQAKKAQLAAEAVQTYQAQVQQVNANNTQFLQQLFMQQQSAKQQLQAARAKAQAVADNVKWQPGTDTQDAGFVNLTDQQFTPVSTGYMGDQGGESITGDSELDKWAKDAFNL